MERPPIFCSIEIEVPEPPVESKRLERKAKVAVRFGVSGRNGEGLAIAGGGLIEPAQAPERKAKVVMGLGVIGRNGQVAL